MKGSRSSHHAPTTPYSISGRLARRVAVLVGVSLTVIVLLIYATTAWLMQRKQAAERSQKIEIIQLIMREAAVGGSIADVQHALATMAQRRPGTRLEVRRADGSMVYSDPDEPPFRLSANDLREPFSIDLPALGGERLSATLGLDCVHDGKMMRSLAWFLAFLPLVGGGVVGAGTAWRVRCELEPLHRLAQQTKNMSADRLDQRLAMPAAAAELQPWIDQFNALMGRLQAAIEQLDAFNADVAHELRTPIAALMGNIEVSLARERPAQELRETMTGSLEELQQLSLLVDDMLFLSHADSGERARRGARCSLRALAEKVAEYHEITFEEAGVSARVTGDAQAAVDSALIQRALSNLLSNAARYADKGTAVVVRIQALAAEDTVQLVVENHGVMIQPEQLPRLFDRFFRTDRARRDCHQHHGLGLAIVAAVARMHGGHTLAESGGGLTRIGFDIACESEAPPPAPPRQSAGARDPGVPVQQGAAPAGAAARG